MLEHKNKTKLTQYMDFSFICKTPSKHAQKINKSHFCKTWWKLWVMWKLWVSYFKDALIRYTKKNFTAPFNKWGSTDLELQGHYKETVYFLPLSPQKFLVPFDQPRKGERLSQPCSHPVVLNTGPQPQDWESIALTIWSAIQ